MPRPPKAKSAAKDATNHLAPQTALRDSAFLQSEASPQVVSVTKHNMAGFVLANGNISSTAWSPSPASSSANLK